MFGLIKGNFIEISTGKPHRTIKLKNISQTKEWKTKQDNSAEEYRETHQIEHVNPETKILYQLFKSFIYANITYYLNYPINILDVGCGTFVTPPPYIELTKNTTYVGLDPYDINNERDYLFIQGVIEDLPLFLETDVKFDVFIFSTSLDHIQKINDAANAIKTIASKDAYVIFFIGLHDVELVAEMAGRHHYKKVFSSLNIGMFFYQMLGTILLRLPRLFLSLKKREKALTNDEPLDTFHFHYFTRENYKTYISNFGTILEDIDIPGSNSKFISVRIS